MIDCIGLIVVGPLLHCTVPYVGTTAVAARKKGSSVQRAGIPDGVPQCVNYSQHVDAEINLQKLKAHKFISISSLFIPRSVFCS